MASLPPFVYLAFANDRDNYLTMIAREKGAITTALFDLVAAQRVQLWTDDDTSIAGMFKAITGFNGRMAMFHYGGHANGTGLDLETPAGNEMAQAGGLAQLLGGQSGLQLVFLNGCATKGQVAALLKAGVPAVIATSVPIEDAMATEFAEQFYLAMTHGTTIQVAFDTARAFIATKYGAQQAVAQFRGFEVTGNVDPADPSLTWGLYVRDGGDAALAWTLPMPDPPPPPPALIAQGKINDVLTARLTAALTAFDGPVKNAIVFAQSNEDDAARQVVLAIINAFPAPIGEQLRILYQQDTLDLDRLKQLIVTYEVMMQLFAYAVLAQLWSARVAKPDLAIADAHRAALNSFLSLNRATMANFDYYGLIVHCLQILKDNAIEPFLRQCDAVLGTLVDVASTDAHTFLEQTRRALAGTIPADQLPAQCTAAVGHVCELLSDLAFIVLYKPTTIRSISVDKYGSRKAQFVHATVALDGVTMPPAQHDRSYDAWTDSQSVILQQDRTIGGDYLNLTPLIIDENAFIDARIPKLYFFCFHDPDAGTYVYRLVNNADEYVAIPDPLRPHLDPVKTMFDEFKAVVFA